MSENEVVHFLYQNVDVGIYCGIYRFGRYEVENMKKVFHVCKCI